MTTAYLRSYFRFLALAALLLPVIPALSEDTVAKPRKWQALEFLGQTYEFGSFDNTPLALHNYYFPKGDTVDTAGKRLSASSFPTVGNCLQHVQRMEQGLRKNQPNAFFSIMPDSGPNAAICAILSQIGEEMYLVEVWHFKKPNPNKVGAIATQWAMRASGPDALIRLDRQLSENMGAWGQAILNFEHRSVEMRLVEERPGDFKLLGGVAGEIKGLKVGRPVKVDAAFAKQLKAESPPPYPFQVLLPLNAKNAVVNGSPNIAETALFGTTTEESMLIEAVRYTTISHDYDGDGGVILQVLSAMLEREFGGSMFGRWGGGVIDRYETRIGGLPAAVILGESANPDPDGPNFFFKFVALPKPGTKGGLGIAIMIDKEAATAVNSIADLATKGFAASVLHSTEFLDE